MTVAWADAVAAQPDSKVLPVRVENAYALIVANGCRIPQRSHAAKSFARSAEPK